MADSPNTFFSPYPGTLSQTGDTGDDAYRAALVSHSAASVERNQDAQFSAGRAQAIHRDVEAGKLVTRHAQFETERGDRQAERESARQYADLKAELAAMRAEAVQRELVALRDSVQNKTLESLVAAVKSLAKA
jgi:hypothetical protein